MENKSKLMVGDMIRRLRKKNNITQDRLAEYLGVTPQAVSRWESGVCYPDLNSLPPIADYFGVSMDVLLGYNGNRRNARVEEYIAATEKLLDRDRITDALELLRGALAEFPGDFNLQLELAGVLSLYAEEVQATGHGERAEAALHAALTEAVSICRHIIAECTEDEVRDETKKLLCSIYAHQLDDIAEARDMASQMHGMDYSREIITATMLTGEDAFNQAQMNLILFANNMWWHMYNLACVPAIAGNRYTVAEQIAILEKGLALFDVIFDDTPLHYADLLANSHRQLTFLHLSQGNTAAAMDAFEKMVDYAVAFDERPATATYTSVIINRVPYDRSTDSGVSKCARLLRGMSDRRLTSLQGDKRYQEALLRLRACAEAHREDDAD
ncbi:MAG: helix-turn-helix domain-containing protein [Clostridia bacterium]|nr:helix-turn-helix domain-containing protein [Clostridia bacterium]